MNRPTIAPQILAGSRRKLAAIAATLGLAGVGVFYLAGPVTAAESKPAPAAATPAAPKVTVAPVEERLVTEYHELTGRVDAQETVELRARVSGHLDAVSFQAGQLVRKGDVLFKIDSRWHQAQYELAKAQVDQARARAEIAEREAKRAEQLVAAAAISSEEAEGRRSAATEARAALATAQAALSTAQLDLEHTLVRAPIDGRVSRAFVTAGNLVSGSPGAATLLTTIVSTGAAFVYADLDESAVLRFNRLLQEKRIALENGRVPVYLQLADETGYPRQGYIESVDNRLNTGTGSLVLRMVFSNDDQALVPGLFARVRLPMSAPERSLLISERAIGTDQSQKFVLAVGENNTVQYRTVKLGHSLGGQRVVREGLKSGERIVVNGLQRVRPGMTVAPEVAVAGGGSGSNATHVAAR